MHIFFALVVVTVLFLFESNAHRTDLLTYPDVFYKLPVSQVVIFNKEKKSNEQCKLLGCITQPSYREW